MPAEEALGTRAVVFAGGDVPLPLNDLEPSDTLVIAADSGVDHARSLGWPIHLVVGDLDSVSTTGLDDAVTAGARVERHPPDKDATDLELALTAARDAGATEVIVVGGHGGRVDHFLANVLLLAHPAFSNMQVRARFGHALVTVVRHEAVLTGHLGELCSLLPVGGIAREVRTTGLRFPLHGENLNPGSTRGVSNQFDEPRATVTVDAGVLVALQPEWRSS